MTLGIDQLRSILMQPIDTARHYSLSKLRGDATAGLTVAVVAIPQTMAYAVVAGVAPKYGLYTAIVQGLIGSLFNSSRYLAVGPMITQSLLTAYVAGSLISEMPDATPEQRATALLGVAVVLALVKGLMQLAMAALRLGQLVRYVSQSVTVGFSSGAGVLIFAGQIPAFFGFRAPHVENEYPGVPGIMQRLSVSFDRFEMAGLGIGALALVIVVASRVIHRRIPGPLIAMVVTTAAVFIFGFTAESMYLVGTIDDIARELPSFSMPQLTAYQLEPLLVGAFAMALIGVLEPYSISKSMAMKTGERIRANQELFSQGITNTISAFFQCIPGSGSFSRSALNYYAGARTLYAGVFCGLFVAIVLLALGPVMEMVPMPALAAVLFVIAFGLIDYRYMLRLWRTNRSDAVVCFITFLATLILPLSYAIYVGIFLNLALYVRQASSLKMAEMVRSEAGPFHEREITDRTGQRAVAFLSLEGDLFFGIADELQDRLNSLAKDHVRVVILRLKRTHSVDATVLAALDQFVQNQQEAGGHVILCGVRPDLMGPLTGYGLVDLIGEENIFETRYGVFSSAKAALQRAREILGESIDDDAVVRGEAEETEGWSYQI